MHDTTRYAHSTKVVGGYSNVMGKAARVTQRELVTKQLYTSLVVSTSVGISSKVQPVVAA